MLLFAWPSLGEGVSPRTYWDERKLAEMSGVALGRAMLKAVDFIRATPRKDQCRSRIHLMAHSMGNWVLRGAIQHMRTFTGENIPPLFDQVLMMAADEDADTLSAPKKLAPLLRGCHRVTVYKNQQDLALKASDVAMGNPDRLGNAGPENRETLPAKVSVVNVAPAIIWEAKTPEDWTEDKTGHQYYRNNQLVQTDMLQVLSGVPDEEIKGRTPRDKSWRLG